MVNDVLKVNCRECGLNDTHSTKFHNQWSSNKAFFCLPDSPPFLAHKALLASADNTSQDKPAPSGSADSVTFSCATMESNISHAERTSTDPNAGTVAQIIRTMFLN
jgi:hypothetical protein